MVSAHNDVLITGGAGFIGSHLAQALAAQGQQVWILDDFSSAHEDYLPLWFDPSSMQIIQSNVAQPWPTELEPCGTIYHLASPASPKDYLLHPVHTLLTGSQGTYWALEHACLWKARLILASTSEVYGDPLVHPQREDYWGNVNPLGPRSAYDESKRYAEALSMAYHRSHDVNIGIARIFNTYGPRMRLNDGRVITNFINQILEHQPLTVYGQGQQTRSFCYIDDVVRALVLLQDRKETGPFNLGNPQEISVLDLVQTLQRMLNKDLQIVQQHLPQDDPCRRCPDISLIRELCAWTPQISLQQGLQSTWDFFNTEI